MLPHCKKIAQQQDWWVYCLRRLSQTSQIRELCSGEDHSTSRKSDTCASNCWHTFHTENICGGQKSCQNKPRKKPTTPSVYREVHVTFPLLSMSLNPLQDTQFRGEKKRMYLKDRYISLTSECGRKRNDIFRCLRRGNS